MSVFAFAGCRQDNVTPIRNVRFDPKLLNPMKVATNCTNYSYQAGSRLRNLGTMHTGKAVVAFPGNLTATARDQVLAKYGFVEGILSQSAGQAGTIYTIKLVSGLNCAQAEEALQVLSKDEAILYAGPSFIVDNNQTVGLSNEVMVKADAKNKAALQQLTDNYKARLIGPLGADTYLVQLDKHSKGNALQFLNELSTEKGITHAAPDFVLAP